MKAREIMTSEPACCTPDQTARDAARVMREHDCGCVPVVDDLRTRHVVGVVTDRDLAIRALADGKGPDTRIRDVMSIELGCCTTDADLRDVELVMAEWQVRRVPILDGDGGCVGIIAQADLARRSSGEGVSEQEVARVIERISEPAPAASRVEEDRGLRP